MMQVITINFIRMKKFLGIVVLSLLLIGNAFAEHFILECSFENEKYEQIIKHEDNKTDGHYLLYRHKNNSKMEFMTDNGYVTKFEITVKDNNETYNLNGFSPLPHKLSEKWFVFLGDREIISSYLRAQNKDGESFRTYKITSLLSHGPRRIMEGTCKKFDKKL